MIITALMTVDGQKYKKIRTFVKNLWITIRNA